MEKTVKNHHLDSLQERFFLINLKTQKFKVFHVTHAINSGDVMAESFTNTPFRLKSSLGFMRTVAHSGKFGKALRLYSLSPSNTRLTIQAERGPILIHGAEYAGLAYLKKFGRLGRSYGCFTVSYDHIGEVLNELGSDALVLSYNDAWWEESQRNPTVDLGHVSAPKATEWETQENLNGQRKGPPGTYLKLNGP